MTLSGAQTTETATLSRKHVSTPTSEITARTHTAPSTAGVGTIDVEAFVRTYFADVPVLVQIARCESRFRQNDSTTGSVLRGIVNSNDVGVMQINTFYHAASARALGMDLYTLEGNLTYARNLYEREGTKPWNASRACWAPDHIAMR